MGNFKSFHLDLTAGRTELHDALNLTGAEVSLNNLPTGVSIPFVHAHTNSKQLSAKAESFYLS